MSHRFVLVFNFVHRAAALMNCFRDIFIENL